MAVATTEDNLKHTQEHLLTDYCDYLAQIGQPAHPDARSIFMKHVMGSWPKVAALPAREVTMEQIADTMRRVLGLGKGRTANKLRSSVQAA